MAERSRPEAATRRPLVIDLVKTLGVIVWSVSLIVAAWIARLLTGDTRVPLGMARHPWASGILAMTGFSVRTVGDDRVDWSRPYFVISNHQSFLDIPVLFHVVPSGLHFVVKQELAKVPFLAGYIRAMGMIFVDRSRPDKARKSVQKTAEIARSGKTILLFPEGTRSRDGNIGTLKSGMLAAAAQSSVPILPVVLVGTGEGMPPGWVSRYRPRRLLAMVGEPIDTCEYSAGDRRALAERVRRELVELQRRGLRQVGALESDLPESRNSRRQGQTKGYREPAPPGPERDQGSGSRDLDLGRVHARKPGLPATPYPGAASSGRSPEPRFPLETER